MPFHNPFIQSVIQKVNGELLQHVFKFGLLLPHRFGIAFRYCAWTSVIPMLRFNPDFRAWAKQRRERPAHANPLNGREVVGAALNRLLRLAFAMVKSQTYYQVSKLEMALVAV